MHKIHCLCKHFCQFWYSALGCPACGWLLAVSHSSCANSNCARTQHCAELSTHLLLCHVSGGGAGRQSAAEHRKAVIDRLYSGDAALRHLETLSLLDAEVWTLCIDPVARVHAVTRGVCPKRRSRTSFSTYQCLTSRK